ncbi:PH domain-containing protein [Aurantiacibacter gangjinensis]|uniref:Uncharacterized protein n=1 Tax=Aurantiacibacter gangjinensis TaxID=502682 RepID=A0A0G9MLS8_9SPHN|nr:PH domain-containing protein [Aurantiacibacter gangjinensis]APE27596.1 membrane-flanked domain [Aurantiacibacter gangjinensis]KLE31632.1 hypothetical protein AAW01_08815 [Aurantiacibacter gangjinensis]
MSELDVAEVTEIADDGWRRVNALTIIVSTLRSLVQSIIPLIVLSVSIGRDNDGGSVFAAAMSGIVLAIIAAIAFGNWLSWYRMRYRIGDNDIRMEKGVLSRAARSIPYDRIQDVSLEQKLLPRLLGLVQVKFETGAGGKDELVLAYVDEAEGEALRETVRSLVDAADDTSTALSNPGSGTVDTAKPREAERVLFTMDPRRLGVYGLFSFSLVIFAVILGAAQQLEFLLPFDLWDNVERYVFDRGYEEAGDYIGGMNMAARIAGLLYLAVAIIGVGLLSGIIKTFARDYGFALLRTDKGFRRQRGLLTKTDVVMPVHRVQALVLSTGWLRRRFGWHGLSVISLAQDSGSANHDIAPFAQMEEIAPIAAEAGFTLPDEAAAWRRPSPKYYTDSAIINVLFVALFPIVGLIVAAANATTFNAAAPVALVGFILLAAFLAVREYYLWRFDRHALDPEQIVSRRGWLSPRVKFANRVKLHSVEIAQGPIARLRGYCDLRFGMAGGSFAFEGLAVEDARELRAAVLESIAAVDFAKLAR